MALSIMQILLVDNEARKNLFPLTLTRAVAGLRMGILTAKERWQKLANANVQVLTENYLQTLYDTPIAGDYLVIDPSLIPADNLFNSILHLEPGEALYDASGLIACRILLSETPIYGQDFLQLTTERKHVEGVKRLGYTFHIFQWNSEVIAYDFNLLTEGRISENIHEGITVKHSSSIFIENGATIENCSLNASGGPIYIGRNSVIMEGSFIRGPFALGEGGILKMGSKMYGATTIGPACTAGGEIKNAVMMGYSNKAHDGYLGDSVIGEWCNLGAGTSNSNIKNTAGNIMLHMYDGTEVSAGNKCGVIMGDYSKTAINTSINTGAVIGVCCNIFGDGLSEKYIPDFRWGTESRYNMNKAFANIAAWKQLKGEEMSEAEIQMLSHIYNRG